MKLFHLLALMHATMVNGINKFVYGGTCGNNPHGVEGEFIHFCALDGTACPSQDWNDFYTAKMIFQQGSSICTTRPEPTK